MDFIDLLRDIIKNNNLNRLDEAVKMCNSGDVRDVEWNQESLLTFSELLPTTWQAYNCANNKAERTLASERIRKGYEIFFIVIHIPEFTENNGASVFGEEWLKSLFERLEMCPITDEIEVNFLRNTLHWTYASQPESRPVIKPWMGHVLTNFANNPTKNLAVSAILEVMADMIRGFQTPLTTVQKRLFHHVLLPLHRPNKFFEWRDQLPILQLYHRPLVMCLLLFLEREPSLLLDVVEVMKEVWPEGFNSNTAKEVILLHELEMLLDSGIGETYVKMVIPPLLPKIAGCIASENWRLNEKVLGLWKNNTFVRVMCEVEGCAEYYPPIMAALLRGGTPHWNPTVRRMTSLVLETMREKSPDTFAAATEIVWKGGAPVSAASLLMKGDPHVHHSKPKAVVDIDVIGEAVVYDGSASATEETSAKDIIAEHNGAGFPVPAARKPTQGTDGSIRPGAPVKLSSIGATNTGGGGGGGDSDTGMLKIPTRSGGNSIEPGKGFALTAAPWASSSKPAQTGHAGKLGGIKGGAMGAAPWANKAPIVIDASKGPLNPQQASENMLHLPPKHSHTSKTIESGKGMSLTAAPWAGGGQDKIQVTKVRGSEHSIGEISEEDEESNQVTMDTSQPAKIGSDAMLHLPPRHGHGQQSIPSGKGMSLTAAPWASPSEEAALTPQRRTSGGSSHLPGLNEKADEMNDEKTEQIKSSMDKMMQYMDACRPDEDEQDNSKSWLATQMAATPTLLPSLKFHDLVFGNQLGSGSFSTVKYARQIVRFDQAVPGETTEEATARERRAQKQRGRSVWPEYAVKVISTEKIKEMGYEQNVVREIAVLRNLSHPGIARLVSCFRWRDGVYMVLEYAAKGDLHNLITTNGSLDLKSARFVVGEIIAALSSIHDVGLVFGDLKPENILITEGGHIKLTDFGGCRPITDSAREALSASKSQLGSIRDGDWRTETDSNTNMDESGQEGSEEDTEAAWTASLSNEDGRVEGTVAYCAPEVVRGEELPSFVSDVWSLGCVAYFLLRGRIPFFHDTVEGLKHSIVNFIGEDYSKSAPAPPITTENGLDYPTDMFPEVSREFISKLLQPDPNLRLSLSEAAHHTFFSDFGVDVFALHFHQPYLLHTGSAAPPPQDAKWARRQHSHIWAPELEVYDFSQGKDKKCSNLGYYKTGAFNEVSTDEVDFLGAPAAREKKKSKTDLPPISQQAPLGGISE